MTSGAITQKHTQVHRDADMCLGVVVGGGKGGAFGGCLSGGHHV